MDSNCGTRLFSSVFFCQPFTSEVHCVQVIFGRGLKCTEIRGAVVLRRELPNQSYFPNLSRCTLFFFFSKIQTRTEMLPTFVAEPSLGHDMSATSYEARVDVNINIFHIFHR